MKFPRNARLLRSTLDVAPFAVVFFLLVIFLTLAALLPTPGLSLRLPAASDLPGTDKPTVAVAVDADGRLFFANQIVTGERVEITSGAGAERFRRSAHPGRAGRQSRDLRPAGSSDPARARCSAFAMSCSPHSRGSPANPARHEDPFPANRLRPGKPGRGPGVHGLGAAGCSLSCSS